MGISALDVPHTRVLKVPSKRRSINSEAATGGCSNAQRHLPTNWRKLNRVLDSYGSSVRTAFAQLTESTSSEAHHQSRHNAKQDMVFQQPELTSQAVQAVDLIVADFVERLIKGIAIVSNNNSNEVISPHVIKRALKEVIPQESPLYDMCIGMADHYVI